MKEFILPEMPYGVVSGVYKMMFDCGSYYIGSAIDLHKRFAGWKTRLINGIPKNHKITDAFSRTNKVVFEIIEIANDPIMIKFREDGYIKINFGKAGCLNIAPSAYSNKGAKQNPNKNTSHLKREPVAKVDDSGNIIEKYISVAEAVKKNNISRISKCFKNSYVKINGMIFRKLDKDGNIIEAPCPPPKIKQPRKERIKGYKISEAAKKSRREKRLLRLQSPDYIAPQKPKHSKKVFQYTVNGELIKVHDSILSAAREFNSESRNFKRQINKSKRNYYKGYIFKYQEQ